MPRLAAQRCVLHPKATLAVTKHHKWALSASSLGKNKVEEEEVCAYVCTVYEPVRVCVWERERGQDLMVRKREMERGLERGVEGWGGPLIWKVWCEWRTSGSPRWWILLHMQYGKVIHPSFSVFYLLPSSWSLTSAVLLLINTQLLFFLPPRGSLTSLPPSCFPASVCWAAAQNLQTGQPRPLHERELQLSHTRFGL